MNPTILATIYVVLGITFLALSITQFKSHSCDGNDNDKDKKCVKGSTKVMLITSGIIGVGFIIAGGYEFYKNYAGNKPVANVPTKFYFF